VNDLWGTAANRVFFVGLDTVNKASAVVYYDGTGFTSLAMPMGATDELWGVWAAPTNEVFAVGESGLILQGP
jgi:hypothetical protein